MVSGRALEDLVGPAQLGDFLLLRSGPAGPARMPDWQAALTEDAAAVGLTVIAFRAGRTAGGHVQPEGVVT